MAQKYREQKSLYMNVAKLVAIGQLPEWKMARRRRRCKTKPGHNEHARIERRRARLDPECQPYYGVKGWD